MSGALVWVGAGAIALAIAAAPAMFGEIEDHRAEHQEAAAIEAAEKAQALGDRKCQAARGPNSDARWTLQGELTCRMRNKYVRLRS